MEPIGLSSVELDRISAGAPPSCILTNKKRCSAA
jgi:hypothetical protein